MVIAPRPGEDRAAEVAGLRAEVASLRDEVRCLPSVCKGVVSGQLTCQAQALWENGEQIGAVELAFHHTALLFPGNW